MDHNYNQSISVPKSSTRRKQKCRPPFQLSNEINMNEPTPDFKNGIFTPLRNYLIRSGKLRVKSKYIVLEARRIARDDSNVAAAAFLEIFGNEDQKLVSHLLRANAALSAAEWQEQMNAFLTRWGISPTQFRPGSEKRFYRLKSMPLRALQNEKRVTVIMPAFYCKSAVTAVTHAAISILNLTWRDLEFIIVNDASSDGSWFIYPETCRAGSVRTPPAQLRERGTLRSQKNAFSHLPAVSS